MGTPRFEAGQDRLLYVLQRFVDRPALREAPRTIVLPAIILLGASISGGALGQAAPSSEIAPTGKLRVGMTANRILLTQAPDGRVSGVGPDLGKFIAKRLGLPFEPVIYSNPEAYTQSFGKGGEWDIAIGGRSRLAAEKADFSPDLILIDYMLFIAAPDREFADAAQVDRPGVKVGVARNSGADQFLSRALKSAELVRAAPGVTAIEMLRSGKVDVYGASGEMIYTVADGLPGAKIVPGVFNTGGLAVAFPKGRSSAVQGKLAEIVNEAKRTGVVRKAIEQAGLRGLQVAPD